MNDKKVERNRYDGRALKLLSKGSFDKDTGSSSYSLPIRTPYLRYEEMHIEFIDNNDNVLEIGAGTGIHTHSLLETGAFVVATDISPNSVQIIKKKYKKYSDKLIAKVADMEHLPFGNETFDVVCSAGSLSYGDNQIVMNEIYRVLKKGGVMIAVDSLNNNPVYRLNRYMHYLKGNRSKSTLIRMPTISLIDKYTEKFGHAEVKFFGSITWIFPLLSKVLSEQALNKLSNWTDANFNIQGSAFKFVIMLEKK